MDRTSVGQRGDVKEGWARARCVLLALILCMTIGLGSGCGGSRREASSLFPQSAQSHATDSWEDILPVDLETTAWLNYYSAMEECTIIVVESKAQQPQAKYPPFDAWGEPKRGVGSSNLLLVGYLNKPELGVALFAYAGIVETLVGGESLEGRYSFPDLLPGAIIAFSGEQSSEPRVCYRLFQ